ncbi:MULTISPECIES: hypothetical protein [unclassified Ruegeria]|uniref:hypothetical protein n=1 Tax=unclassified Ruegeria TaxID=2625375 RepID=UPI0014894218|nr:MULTISPECIES: hypothetical protein [unclassified Ruegeria]
MSYKDEFQAESVFPSEKMLFGAKRIAFWGAIALGAVILLVGIIWPVPTSTLNQEGGLIETVSAMGLFAAGLAAFYRFPGLSRMYIGLVCLLLAERELESDIYPVGSLPFEILNGLDAVLDITAVRVVLGLIVLFGLIRHGIPNGWRALRGRASFMVMFVVAGLFAVLAQGLEEVSYMFRHDFSGVMMVRFFVLEETLEMFFSIGILAAVLIGWPKAEIEETLNDREPQPDPR